MSMNYKSECLNGLEDVIREHLHKIDNALQTCLDDYYKAPETRDMLRDTMNLFVVVQEFAFVIKHDNERDDMLLTKDLIVEGMSEREGCGKVGCSECTIECKTDDKRWDEYVKVLKQNTEYTLERLLDAPKRFREDKKCFENIFM